MPKRKRINYGGRPKQPAKEGLHLTNWGSPERVAMGNRVEIRLGLSIELRDI